MISCRRAAELTSLQLDTDLGVHQKLALGFHRAVCGPCRRFANQMREVDDATGKFLTGESPAHDEPMPEEMRLRIQSMLNSANQAK
jgi:hypothetical protein